MSSRYFNSTPSLIFFISSATIWIQSPNSNRSVGRGSQFIVCLCGSRSENEGRCKTKRNTVVPSVILIPSLFIPVTALPICPLHGISQVNLFYSIIIFINQSQKGIVSQFIRGVFMVHSKLKSHIKQFFNPILHLEVTLRMFHFVICSSRCANQ